MTNCVNNSAHVLMQKCDFTFVNWYKELGNKNVPPALAYGFDFAQSKPQANAGA